MLILLILLFLSIAYGIEQVHLAVAGEDGQSMMVSWVSKQNNPNGTVYYGNGQLELESTNAGKRYRFNGGYTSGYIYHVELRRLKASCLYYYRIGKEDRIRNFTSMPKWGEKVELEFGVIGDLGQTNYSRETLGYLGRQKHLKAVLHAGDLSYADFDQRRWDDWGRMVEEYADYLPWMVGPGNHEIEPNHMLQTFVAYQARFKMPYEESKATDGNLYYSFSIGSVHFVYLTPYSDSSVHSKQYIWLKKDLQRMNRKKTPWLIVVMHAPWYNSNIAHQSILEPQYLMKHHMESLLYQYRVDIVLSGHVHAYERSYPVYKQKRTPDAPHYIVIGDAGNREGIAANYIQPQPIWSAFRKARYGYGHLHIKNESVACFDWHQDTALYMDVSDSFCITRTAQMRRIPTTPSLRYSEAAAIN